MGSGKIGKVHIGIFAVIWLAFMTSNVDRFAWGSIMPVASASLGLSGAGAGGLMTAFFIGYISTQLPGGYLADRFGYRRVLLCSFVVMGLFTALMGTVKSNEAGFVYRGLAGMGSGCVYSSSLSAVFDWLPERTRGTVIGLFLTASSLGLSAANLLTPVLAGHYNWASAFYIIGTATFSCFFLALFFLKESPERPEAAASTEGAGKFLDLFKNRNLILISLAGFGFMWGAIGTATWANSYMHNVLDLSLVEAGAIMSVYGAVAVLAKPISGFIADLIGIELKYLSGVMLLFFAAALVLFGLNDQAGQVWLWAVLLALGFGIPAPMMNLLIGQAAPPGQVGASFGLANTVWQAGSLCSPLAAGLALDLTQNYLHIFLTLALGPAIGAVAVIMMTTSAK